MVKNCEYFLAVYAIIEEQYQNTKNIDERLSLLKRKRSNFEEALTTLSPDELYNMYTFLEMSGEKGIMLRALDRAARNGHRLAIRKRAKYVVVKTSTKNSGCAECRICNCSKAKTLAKGEAIMCTTRCDDYSCLKCPVSNCGVIKAL